MSRSPDAVNQKNDTADVSLILAAQGGSRDAEEQLIRDNLPLVHALMKRFIGRGVESEDLRQLGMLGLLKAVRRFDPQYGVCFSTYAVPLIIGEIKRFLRDDGMIKYSRASKQLAGRVAALPYDAAEKHLSEIAKDLNCTEEELAVAMSCRTPSASLDAEIGDSELTLLDAQATESHENASVDRLLLESLMQQLPDRERLILHLRYYRDMTQTETAKHLGISQVQVSRTEKKILTRLRQSEPG